MKPTIDPARVVELRHTVDSDSGCSYMYGGRTPAIHRPPVMLSWRKIGLRFGVGPSVVRAIYERAMGKV